MIYDKIICQKCIIERRLFEAVVLPQQPQPIHQWKHRDLRVHINWLIVVYGPLLLTAAAASTTGRLQSWLGQVHAKMDTF